jgi:hypothetical protein
MFDKRWLQKLRADVNHAGQRSASVPVLCDFVGVIDAVLQREDGRLVAD